MEPVWTSTVPFTPIRLEMDERSDAKSQAESWDVSKMTIRLTRSRLACRFRTRTGGFPRNRASSYHLAHGCNESRILASDLESLTETGRPRVWLSICLPSEGVTCAGAPPCLASSSVVVCRNIRQSLEHDQHHDEDHRNIGKILGVAA